MIKIYIEQYRHRTVAGFVNGYSVIIVNRERIIQKDFELGSGAIEYARNYLTEQLTEQRLNDDLPHLTGRSPK